MPNDTPETVDTTTSTDAGTAAPAAEVPEWDGSLEAAASLPWWNTVPEAHREKLTDLYGHRSVLSKLLEQDDGAAQVKAENDGLRKSLAEVETKYKAEIETHKKESAKYKQDYESLAAEVESERAERAAADLEAKYPDIFAAVEKDDAGNITGGALVEFARLVNAGVAHDRAAKMTRAAFDMPAPGAAPAEPEKPKVRDVKPPTSVEIANKNGLNPAQASEKPVVQSSEEAHRAYRKKLEDEPDDE